jgi:hypothetical protein
MKLTKSRLQQIIKEEIRSVITENKSSLPKDLQDKSNEELADLYAGMLLSGKGDKNTLDALADYLEAVGGW